MIFRALAIGIIGLGIAGCDSDMLHQDRPGGSDYQPGAYRNDQGDYRGRGSASRGDEREYCYRNPEACRPR
jgi:hypothetical protein